MNRIALNIICKDESHIILNLLESVRPIIDLIVAVDTGSTDMTISIIKEFGRKHDIVTFVFERPFDNFCNSRNFALDKLIAVTQELKWSPEQLWGLTIDCDEILNISEEFEKEQLCYDIYWLLVNNQAECFNRISLFRISKAIRWEFPVHEVIVWEDPTITSGTTKHLTTNCASEGASWKGDLEKKFLKYASLLIEYKKDGHQNFRTLYYIGNSYRAAADYCKSKIRAKEYLAKAREYYEQIVCLANLEVGEKILLYSELATLRIELKEGWPQTNQLLLNAYALDFQKGESFEPIIGHYISTKQWNLAYLFSYFAYNTYNGTDPFSKITGITRPNLYHWEFALYQSICAFMTGRNEEAKSLRQKLNSFIMDHFDSFSVKDLRRTRYNMPLNLSIRYWKTFLKRRRLKIN
jgi:hypothetical protein